MCKEIQSIVSEADTEPLIDQCSVENVFVSVEDEKCYSSEPIENNETVAVPTVVETDPSCNEINMVDYTEEETNCVTLPDDILETPLPSVPLPDELLDCIESNKDINDETNTCLKSSLDYPDLFESGDLFKDFDSILDSYQHPDVLLNQPSSSSSSSLNGDVVDVGEEWDDLLTDLFPSLSSM